ncbi:MAG TPA: 23S rRNA (pseudouridine(1915)-N(3))-methyltransferase RlmH [Longimicrobiales bacterium]|nr:23S rRNA (pseudouridine(1915)-N(3))-methyltransferase RlmH [Longimicrobiales bacterium]
MKVLLVVVGKPSRTHAAAIADYEKRAARYWPLEVIEVKPVKAGGSRSDEDVRAAESDRLLERVPRDVEVIALTRVGERWSSEQLSAHLQRHALRSSAGVALLIGGALGLGAAAVRHAAHRLSLSSMTMPHDVARLVLAEQLYRAGTIARGEPYHKGR